MEHLRYPNESAAYRAARNALLDEEIALRAQIEAVAAKRRALPPGGEVPRITCSSGSARTSMPEKVKMSELFGPHDTLILYSFMYGPERDKPCPGCTHLLDGIDGAARHIAAARGFLYRRQIADRAARRLGARARLGSSAVAVDRRQQLRRRLFRRHVEVSAGDARAARGSRRQELGRDDVQRVPEGRTARSAISGAARWSLRPPSRASTTAPATWSIRSGACST